MVANPAIRASFHGGPASSQFRARDRSHSVRRHVAECRPCLVEFRGSE
jgi:hypothetical protein